MSVITKGNWKYEIIETGVAVCGYNEEIDNIIIPEIIDGKIVEKLYFGVVDSETKSIFIPKTVKEIIMWGYPIALKQILVDKENQWFCSRNGVLYNKDCTTLVRFPCAKEFNNSCLNDVVEIAPLAFANVQKIYSVNFPDSVRRIGADAFNSCETLKFVSMDDNVTEIGPGAFCGCGLEKISLSKNIHKFEMSVYDDEGSGFFSGSDFIEYSVPEHIEVIGSQTFEYSKKLKKVYIPASVKEIGKYVFYECNSLEEIVVSKDNKFYYSEDGVLYSRDGTLIHYPPNKKDTSFIVSDSVTKINAHAFYENKNLKNLTLGNNVSEIGCRAFACSYIETINIPSTVKIIEKDVFLYTSIKELYIPKSVQYIEMNSGIAGNINPYKDIKIFVNAGSYAEKICKENGLNVSIVED